MSDAWRVAAFSCFLDILVRVGWEFPLALVSCCARPCRAQQGQAFREQVGPDTPVEHTTLKRLASASAHALRSPPCGPFLGPAGETPSEIGRCSSHTCATLVERLVRRWLCSTIAVPWRAPPFGLCFRARMLAFVCTPCVVPRLSRRGQHMMQKGRRYVSQHSQFVSEMVLCSERRVEDRP